MASKRLAALPRRRGSALAHGCGRQGSGALPLPRAAAISAGSRVQVGRVQQRLELCRQVELVAVAEVLLAQHLVRARLRLRSPYQVVCSYPYP